MGTVSLNHKEYWQQMLVWRLFRKCSDCSASHYTDVRAMGLLSGVQWTVWILLLCFIVLACFVVGYKQLPNLKFCTLCNFLTCHIKRWIKNCTWPFYGICGKQCKGNDWSCGGNTNHFMIMMMLLCIHHSHPEVSQSLSTPYLNAADFSVFLEWKFSV